MICYWESGGDDGSAIGAGSNFEFAAKLAHALRHSLDANAETIDGANAAGPGGLHADAKVTNFERDFLWRGFHSNGGFWAFGIAMDVSKRFLKNAENGDFGIGGQSSNFGGHVSFDDDAGSARETGNKPFHGGRETQFVQQGRMQQIGKRTDFRGDFFVPSEGFREGMLGFSVQAG